MHGRIKSEQKELTDEEKLYIKKAEELFKECIKLINENRKDNIYSSNTLELTEKLLKLNSEISTLWTYRKDYIVHEYISNNDNIGNILNKELIFTEELFKNDTKSYNLWSNRTWLVEFIINMEDLNNKLVDIENDYLKNIENFQELNLKTSFKDSLMKFMNIKIKILINELMLCKRLLKIDNRNFHCWKYRNFVLAYLRYVSNNLSWKNFQEEFEIEELEFLNDLLVNDFSNYSAWYQKILLNDSIEFADLQYINKEIELIHTAFYTEPNDQSIWQYYDWLMKNFIPKIIFKESSYIVNPSLYIENFQIEVLNDKNVNIYLKLSISSIINNENSQLYLVSNNESKILINGNWTPIHDDYNKICKFENKLPKNFRSSIDKTTFNWKFTFKSHDMNDNYFHKLLDNSSYFIVNISLIHNQSIYTRKPFWKCDQYIFNQSTFSSLNINPKIKLDNFQKYSFVINNYQTNFTCKYYYYSNFKSEIEEWKQILINEFNTLKDIQELEPQCKYPILALKLVYNIYNLCIPFEISQKNEILFDHNILQQLQILDPLKYFLNL